MQSNMQFADGLKTFTINGDNERVITFAPTDTTFVRRVQDGMEKLDACQQKYKDELDATEETIKILDLVDACDKEIRTIIDGIFIQRGISDIIFGNLSTCGVADGMPIWAGFIVALISECDEYVDAQGKQNNPKLQKLLKKYKKK